jgi:hypothetical protein
VHPHDLLAGHREHAERIVIAQVGLAGQREFGQVGQVLAVVRVQPSGVEGRAVVRHVGVRMPQRPAQPLQLQGAQLIGRGPLDGIEVSGRRSEVLHVPVSSVH